MDRKRRLCFLYVFLGAYAFFLGACKTEDAPTGIIFNHEQHLGRGFSCGLCHQFFSYDAPARPPERVCAFCHGIGDHQEPSAACALCHSRLDFSAESLPRPAFDDSRFLHGNHEKAGIACEKCHENQERARLYEDIAFPVMKDCISCHAGRQVATRCETCHRLWRQDVKPESHDDLWPKAHGAVAVEAFETKCDYCHAAKAFCQDCHTAQAPGTHTLFFKNRGHGFTAETDRMSCEPCHQQDFCLECHGPGSGVKPLTHTAAFGARRPYLHCANCHFPAGEAYGCRACHNGATIQMKHFEFTDRVGDPIPPFVPQTSLDCLNFCHPFQTKPPLHPIGVLNNNDCLRCHHP